MGTGGLALHPESQPLDSNLESLPDSPIPLGKGMPETSNCPSVADLDLILNKFII